MDPSTDNHIFPSLANIAEAAVQAGNATLTYFRQTLTCTDKGNNKGIVTNADLAAEAIIKSLVATQFPSHLILAEESGWSTLPSQQSDEANVPIWIVDPLDGTTNFSKGNPYYCVSIAFGLMTGATVKLIHAAIFQPPTGDLYTASYQQGAFLNGQPINVSPTELLAQCSFATGFSSNKGPPLRRVIETIFAFQQQIMGMRINGAAALDLALTARGIFQGFFERKLDPWDMAAGALIVREAGGIVTDMEGNEFKPLSSEDICCANASLHKQMLSVIGNVPMPLSS